MPLDQHTIGRRLVAQRIEIAQSGIGRHADALQVRKPAIGCNDAGKAALLTFGRKMRGIERHRPHDGAAARKIHGGPFFLFFLKRPSCVNARHRRIKASSSNAGNAKTDEMHDELRVANDTIADAMRAGRSRGALRPMRKVRAS